MASALNEPAGMRGKLAELAQNPVVLLLLLGVGGLVVYMLFFRQAASSGAPSAKAVGGAGAVPTSLETLTGSELNGIQSQISNLEQQLATQFAAQQGQSGQTGSSGSPAGGSRGIPSDRSGWDWQGVAPPFPVTGPWQGPGGIIVHPPVFFPPSGGGVGQIVERPLGAGGT